MRLLSVWLACFSFWILTPPPSPAHWLLHVRQRRHFLRQNHFQTGIRFQNVSFRYPGTEENVLKNVSFTIQPGERIAIVGHNGAGKTTLVKLLTRLYDPTEGEILLDDRPYSEYDLTEIRKRIGVIFQDYIHYELTLRDNIGFGSIANCEDAERIEKAATDAGLASLIAGLPKGMDTYLGRTLEDGVDLSGGEWQKVALARAFMQHSQLLILDEPTAALDPMAEEEVFKSMQALTDNCMSVIISHRFSTVRSADRILVFEGGRLLEHGSHNELMARDGAYTKMYRLQAERYRDSAGYE